MSSNPVINKLFGQGPYPFPAEKIAENLALYSTEHVCVSLSKCPTSFHQDMLGHAHDSYEFIIPNSAMPKLRIDKQMLAADANTLIAIHPCQPHGPSGSMQVESIIGIHIDKYYLSELSYQMNSSSSFCFDNLLPFPSQQVKYLMQCFVSESINEQAGYPFILESLSTQISVNLLRNARYSLARRMREKTPADHQSIDRVIDFLRAHYNSCCYSSAEIAKLANLSPYHFIRAFKQHTGKTPYEFLTDIKIEKAKEMLKNNHYSITEICFSCGFTNHSHFSTLFKKKLGVSPTEYRSILMIQ